MTRADAVAIVRSAVDNKPKGFVAVSIDVDALEALLGTAPDSEIPCPDCGESLRVSCSTCGYAALMRERAS